MERVWRRAPGFPQPQAIRALRPGEHYKAVLGRLRLSALSFTAETDSV